MLRLLHALNVSLDLNGQLEDGALVADLVLNETFHSGPMKIVSVRMEDVTLPARRRISRAPPMEIVGGSGMRGGNDGP